MPARKIPKSRCPVTGLISSNKSNELIGYESRLERCFIKHVSFNPNVKTCEEQPVRIAYTMKNGKSSHDTSDFLVYFKDHLKPKDYWKPLLVEIKSRYRLFKDWVSLHPKFLAARKYAHYHDWEFTVISDKELVTPYLDNITFLTAYLNYPTIEFDQNLILSILENSDQLTPEAILQSISSDNDEIMRLIPGLWKLAANLEVWVDLEICSNDAN